MTRAPDSRPNHTSSRADGGNALSREKETFAPSGRCDMCVHGVPFESFCLLCKVEMLEADIEAARRIILMLLTPPENRKHADITSAFAWARTSMETIYRCPKCEREVPVPNALAHYDKYLCPTCGFFIPLQEPR